MRGEIKAIFWQTEKERERDDEEMWRIRQRTIGNQEKGKRNGRGKTERSRVGWKWKLNEQIFSERKLSINLFTCYFWNKKTTSFLSPWVFSFFLHFQKLFYSLLLLLLICLLTSMFVSSVIYLFVFLSSCLFLCLCLFFSLLIYSTINLPNIWTELTIIHALSIAKCTSTWNLRNDEDCLINWLII